MKPFEEIEKQIEDDSSFQENISALSDEEKNAKIEERRKEIIAERLEKAKNHEIAFKDQQARAQKAEADLKKYKPEEKKDDEDNLSSKDLYALMGANVPQEDAEVVVDYAKFKKISVAEALKSSVVKTELAERAEGRRTAAATQTRQTRQTTKTDGNDIINNIKEKGEDGVPNPGSSDAEELFWARRGGRRS